MTRTPLRKTASRKNLAAFTSEARDNAPVAANVGLTEHDAAAMAKSHKPEAFLVCCIDSRFQPAKVLEYGAGVALEHRPIACVIPPEKNASPDLLARMAFRRLNNVATIALVCHSDCGGIQAALKVPRPDATMHDDLHAVAAVVHQSGLDLGKLGREFLTVEKGDMRRAGDRMAREVALQSFRNLLGYKGRDGYATVAEEVKAGVLNVLVMFYDLEQRRFEIYDGDRQKWRRPADAELLFMKTSGTTQASTGHAKCGGH